jgi:nucleoside-diphosphate-sugar epimerase
VRKTALIVGATGVVGRALLDFLVPMPDWDVLALSRRKPHVAQGSKHVDMDLLDAADCRAKAHSLRDVTHVFFAAYVDRADTAAWVNDNTRMFVNLVDAVEGAASNLQHVHVVEGTKWYGGHLGPFKTPAKETDTRHMPPNFYFNQQDFVEARQRGKAWTWSASRPHTICGFSLSSPMNLPLTIAVYAAICKELSLPLFFPGNAGNYRILYQACDATHLARALTWMVSTPACANEAFNITNGDLIRWENVWPKFAKYFGMEAHAPRAWKLTQLMADKQSVWERIVAKHGLKPYRLDQLASWAFADYVFTPNYDIVSDVSKLRRYGFHELVDTEEMFLRLFDQFRHERAVP